MFRYLRICRILAVAGLLGMVAGFLPQVVIYEFYETDSVLLQAISVFKELDMLSFIVCFAGLSGIVVFCILVEWKQFRYRFGSDRFKRSKFNH